MPSPLVEAFSPRLPRHGRSSFHALTLVGRLRGLGLPRPEPVVLRGRVGLLDPAGPARGLFQHLGAAQRALVGPTHTALAGHLFASPTSRATGPTWYPCCWHTWRLSTSSGAAACGWEPTRGWPRAVALLFALLGTGAEDLAWAFQIGFVVSLVFGLLAIEVADGPAWPGARTLVKDGIGRDLTTAALALAALDVLGCRCGDYVRPGNRPSGP